MGDVSKARFDSKFGAGFVASLPCTPGVYLFKAEDDVLYAGKAKDLRRRLSAYRNASRRKVHRKMRTLVREATTIEIRQMSTEREALLLENELIRNERPPYNVDGAFSFLYPALGLERAKSRCILIFTTSPDHWSELEDLQLYGTFRSRLRVSAAFDALVDLLLFLGHREPRSRLPERSKGSRVVGFRQLDRELLDDLELYLAGDNERFLSSLSVRLLDKPSARHEATEVEEHLRTLADFYRSDTRALFEARNEVGWSSPYVPQQDRDVLFIEVRARS